MQWNRKKVFIAVSFFVLLVSVVGGLTLSRSTDDVDVKLTDPGVTATPGIGTNANASGKPFPRTSVVDINSQKDVELAAKAAPMVVNFWFSTCEPCKREMPALAAAAKKYGAAVSFVGVNPNDTATAARTFLEKYSVTFPNYLDDGDLMADVGIVNMPTTVFVNTNGIIVATHAGEITAEQINEIITEEFGVQS